MESTLSSQPPSATQRTADLLRVRVRIRVRVRVRVRARVSHAAHGRPAPLPTLEHRRLT